MKLSAASANIASVKPDLADDTSFLIAKNFFADESLLPGGVEADDRAPLLRLNYVEAKETTRFNYAARVLPFVGRDAETDELGDFLDGPEQPFRWLVLHGSGGVGKSRLALELCLALRSEWHAGFLPQGGEEPDWGRLAAAHADADRRRLCRAGSRAHRQAAASAFRPQYAGWHFAAFRSSVDCSHRAHWQGRLARQDCRNRNGQGAG